MPIPRAPQRSTASRCHPAGREQFRYTGGLLLCRQLVSLVGIALSVLALLYLCYEYLFSGTYLDHIEGNVVISGWQYINGEPLYGTRDGAPQLATYYGPLAYLAEVPALLLFGATVTASKLTSMLAMLATVAVMSAYFIRHQAANEARHGIFLLVAALLLFSPMSFWVRPDPIETLLVAGAVVSTPSRRRSLWVGISIGLAVNLKIHAFLYFLPILADMWWIGGRRAILIVAGSSVATFMLPFLAPGVSFHDYIGELGQQVGGRAPSSAQLPWTLISLALLLLPMAAPLATRRQPRRETVYASATLATVVLLMYPATFPGAGAYHFLPLVPVLADLRHRLWPKGMDVELTTFIILFVAWLPVQYTLQTLAATRGSDLVGAEALAAARKSSVQPVQVGYGDNRQSYEHSELSKTVLSLNSYPALLDAQVVMELQQIGVDGSARWIPYLRDCRIQRWLLPRGEKPFAIASYFYDDRAVFSEEFRRAFSDNYKVVESAEYFDVWECAEGQR
jgi:hypothetical protein